MINDLNIICKIKVGSQLYGTNGPDSDTDYKGVFLPKFEDVVLGNHLGQFPKSIKLGTGNDQTKNTADDIDFELYSLQYYICLLQKSDTGAIEMLFAPDEMIEISSPEWNYLKANRSKFITKKMKSFLGYCRTQASKYSSKGGRLQAINKVINNLSDQIIDDMSGNIIVIEDVWDKLYIGEYVRKYTEPRNNFNMYEVCGRKFENNSSVNYVIEQLQKVYEGYGNRAKEAESSAGVDWKAVSHAFRVGFQLEELLETGDLKFPLREAEFLKKLKYGKFNFKENKIEEKLEELLERLEQKTEESDFNESINIKPFTKWICMLYK